MPCCSRTAIRSRALEKLRASSGERPKPPKDEHTWLVTCIDVNKGKVLWEKAAHRGLPSHGSHVKNSYASETPVADGERVYVSTLGAFNVSTFSALAVEPRASQRVLWTKTTPYLKLPTVSSPAVADGKLIFGDGMHQTDAGATLYCLGLDKGRPYWQLPVLGSLVHMEGSPTVVEGKVFLGAGSVIHAMHH